MALYSEKVMDHFRNPRNIGSMENADGVGEVGNAKCGDIMKIYLKIDDDRVSDVKFETFGCGSAIAASSMATELIKGKKLDEVMSVTNKAVVEALDGLPVHKIHCSVLAEEAIKVALKDYYDKNGIAYEKLYAEDHADLCRTLGITQAPTLADVVNGTVTMYGNLSEIVKFCEKK